MTKNITIAQREEKTINGRDILNIYDESGVRYTHFIEAKNEGWEEQLQEGNTVQVYATEKRNPKNPKYPYRNIYMPKEEETDALMTNRTLTRFLRKPTVMTKNRPHSTKQTKANGYVG